MTPDSSTHYGTISRYLHWGMAGAIVGMYLLAIAWHLAPHLAPQLIAAHKALGMTILMLACLRLLWAIAADTRPQADCRAAFLGHCVP